MFILDASVAGAWLLEETTNQLSERTLARLEDDEAAVPQIWHLEIRNCLLMARRRGRIASSRSAERLAALYTLPIRTDADADFDIAFALAERHGLTFCDAVYLELAKRRLAPLATFDKALDRAAAAERLPPVFGGI